MLFRCRNCGENERDNMYLFGCMIIRLDMIMWGRECRMGYHGSRYRQGELPQY